MTPPDQIAADESAAEEATGRAAALPEQQGASDGWAGREIGDRYRVQGQLGRSVAAHSLRAQQQDGLTVVLKVVREERKSPTLSRRIARRAEGVSKLEHPHIARVVDHGEDLHVGTFVCREFVDGENLNLVAAREPLTPRRIGELCMQVLSALSEAHRHGVLHENLKPQNILVWRDDEGRECVKLCDFGEPHNLATGAPYRAPEQRDPSQTIDGRADVYAVGAMLYELLAGEPPFRGESVEETMTLHALEAVIAPSAKRPDRPLPPELEAVCMKALAKQPGDRHRSPREMSQAIRAVVALLDVRADEPIGSRVFSGDGRTLAPTASTERMTLPGEQLRSHTKFWVGAALLTAVCAAVWLAPDGPPSGRREPALEGARSFPPFVTSDDEQREHGKKVLRTGLSKLRANDAESAVSDLREARKALGDAPEVLRALGEALVIQGSSREGITLLESYLEQEPTAADRKFVESLIRQGRRP
jgi:serine/threonine protein kinase